MDATNTRKQLDELLTTIKEDEEDYERSTLAVELSTEYTLSQSGLRTKTPSIFYRIWNHIRNRLCMYVILLGFIGILIYVCVEVYITYQ